MTTLTVLRICERCGAGSFPREVVRLEQRLAAALKVIEAAEALAQACTFADHDVDGQNKEADFDAALAEFRKAT